MTTKGDEGELLRSVALQNATSILAARRRAERRSEAYLAEAQKLSHSGSFGWRPSKGEIIWSEETFRIFQYDRSTEPTAELVLQRVHPEDAALVQETIERAAQDRKDFDFEHRLLMPDGSVKHVQVVAHAETDESGELEFVGAVMDITERKRAEEALRRSENYLAEAQRFTHTGSWAWQVAGENALHLSDEWYRIYGFNPAKGPPAWEERLQRVHPEDRVKWKRAIDRAIAEASDYEVEFRILLPDGTTKYIRSVGHPVLNASGDLVEFVGSSTDITERKRAEVLLAGENRLLEMITKGDSRADILDAICRLVEELASDSLSSVLLLDANGKCLRHGAAPSLPKRYTAAIDGLVIGPSVGSCGTAAYRAEPVMVSDIAKDPLWADYRDLALAHGLRACWSTPILSSAEKVLGTFAIYYREPRAPSSRDQELMAQITHLAGVAIQRKLTEDALRQSEAYLAEAQRFSHTGSWAGAPGTGEIRYWSEECYRVLGFDPLGGQPRFETFFQRIHPDDQAGTIEQLERASREQTEFEFDYRMVHPSGEIRDIHTVGHPVFTPSGDLFEFVGTVIDITERKRAEQALRRSEAYLSEAQRLTHIGSWACNVLTGEMIHSSEEHSRLYGFDPERGVPSFEEFVQRIHPQDRARVTQAFQSASRARKDLDAHFRVVLPDGMMKYVYGTGHPVFNPSGHVAEFVGIVMDVSERRRADEERERLRQAQAELAHINRVTTMGELAASLAHEVNQPISAASTNANTCLRWLAGDPPNIEEARAAAMRIVKDGKRAAEIIKRIRLLFKKGTPEREPVDLNEVVREMTILLGGETARYNILIATDLAVDLPEVMADRVQLQQVLMNLMLNGIDAMKDVDGARELTIKSQRLENEQLMVSVTDTGVGLPVQHADQIFTAFFTTKPHGTGMGLSISRSIIESHGGHLRAGDNSPRGARFHFTLPSKAEALA